MMSHLLPLLPAGFGAAGAYRPWFAALALLLMAVEFLLLRLNRVESHDLKESAASLAVALGNRVIIALTAALIAIPALFVYEHRLLDIPLDHALAVAVLFLGVELSYYAHHYAMHKVRWFWASHAVHHSPTRINLSAAVRLGWGGHLTGGFLFYLPMIALGFHPAAVFGMLGLGLAYQFFLHLARPPHLGPLEWVLNTPRHHLVHHASNAGCVDRNFGGMLIIFDRLFGTYAEAPKNEALTFGLMGIKPTLNPLKIVFVVWGPMLRDAVRARGARAKMAALFGAPD